MRAGVTIDGRVWVSQGQVESRSLAEKSLGFVSLPQAIRCRPAPALAGVYFADQDIGEVI